MPKKIGSNRSKFLKGICAHVITKGEINTALPKSMANLDEIVNASAACILNHFFHNLSTISYYNQSNEGSVSTIILPTVEGKYVFFIFNYLL
jgi:hypothetical protein